MSNIGFLSHIGCFVKEQFLEDYYCEKLRTEVYASSAEPAKIVNNADVVSINDNYRRTKSVKVSKATLVNLYKRLESLKSEIEKKFNIQLAGCEVPQFLLYREGDFFGAHKDADHENEIKTRTSNRKISVVLFLNDQTPEPRQGGFCGGALNLYGLIDQPGWEDKGFPVGGRTGLLIGFPSHLLHEVVPVTNGERLTVVSWFY